jgi:hypothetical protein
MLLPGLYLTRVTEDISEYLLTFALASPFLWIILRVYCTVNTSFRNLGSWNWILFLVCLSRRAPYSCEVHRGAESQSRHKDLDYNLKDKTAQHRNRPWWRETRHSHLSPFWHDTVCQLAWERAVTEGPDVFPSQQMLVQLSCFCTQWTHRVFVCDPDLMRCL